MDSDNRVVINNHNTTNQTKNKTAIHFVSGSASVIEAEPGYEDFYGNDPIENIDQSSEWGKNQWGLYEERTRVLL
ncbi:hypothetical protein QUF76_02785 [Desulfobacterales bacterium HSG16]|nr:hypothetical protein [Desulfobacterales bacterium HSG16]